LEGFMKKVSSESWGELRWSDA